MRATMITHPILVPRWAMHSLVLATAWLVLLGTLVPIGAPGLGAWLPTHEHQTLASFVPPHTHIYERASNAPGGADCEASPHPHTGAADVHVICAVTDDLASGALAIVLPAEPAALPGAPPAAGASMPGAGAAPSSPYRSILTPPPQA